MKASLPLLLVAGLIACTPAGGANGRNGPATQVREQLDGFLTGRGYTQVPLIRLATGHFSVTGSASDISFDMIIDTGASHTVIDQVRAERFALLTEDRGGRATGLGVSSQRVESGRLDDVVIGPVRFDSLRVTVLDLSHVNQVLRTLGDAPVDGIIGADVLMAQEAVIDYGALMIYFKN